MRSQKSLCHGFAIVEDSVVAFTPGRAQVQEHTSKSWLLRRSKIRNRIESIPRIAMAR